MARWHSCNVLQVGADRRQVWQFDARKDGFVLNQEQTLPLDKPLPAKVVSKTWQSLFQKKLNIAWLPPEQVFLRVVHLPPSSTEEIHSMVELQLEKLSPLPVTHIVWAIHPLLHSADGLQTVVVIIAARNLVEDFLGKLEGQGFLADRLEVPALDALQSSPVSEDSVWVYPDAGNEPSRALVAWWYGGTLRHLGLLSFPPNQDRAAAVREQIAQMAWAGELEGWLTAPPRVHLVADPAVASEWEQVLREGLSEEVRVLFPPAPAELASATAKRAATDSARSSLLPAEYATRYQQQFVDRLWMRGLGAVLGLYVVAVVIYMAAAQFVSFRADAADREVRGLSQSYTNALQLKARGDVLKERLELKFAALDCWKTVAELLPEGSILQGMDFSDGHRLTLTGTSPADNPKDVFEFNEKLQQARVKDQRLFSRVERQSLQTDQANRTARWSFLCELNRTEGQ